MKFGLSNDSGAESKNISIVEGTFRLRVPEGTAGSISRVNKNNEPVNELSFTTLTGYIKKLDFVDTENFGRKMELFIDADKEYKLSLGFADGLASNIYKMLPNIDPSEPVSIVLTRKPDDKGKERTSLFINQNRNAVKWAYTKAEPNGMPGMEQIKVKGVDTWDNTKQIDFLMQNSVKPFQDKLQNVIRKEVSEFIVPTVEIEAEYTGEASPEELSNLNDSNSLNIDGKRVEIKTDIPW